jgi:plasmid stability protein
MAAMRATLWIADDLHAQLKDRAHRHGQPFHAVVDEVLRRGLGMRQPTKPFRVKAFNLGVFRPGIDSEKLNQLADEIADARILRLLGRA